LIDILAHRLNRLRRDIIEEADRLPGTQLVYGRPHNTARNRYHPKWTMTGQRSPGVVIVKPDCPRPIKGRCECPPDGTWRPIGGSQRADMLAEQLVYVRPNPAAPGFWTQSVYELGIDGLWRCLRPHARAMERLRGESLRRFMVLTQLLRGEDLDEAWEPFGIPEDIIAATLSILDHVDRMADAEAEYEYERRPRRWRDTPWTQLSESQQNAETSPAA
jgi:hypothetical protein